jgi:hypothetical protein
VKINQRFIARELGISAAALSKLKTRGMPVTSIEAARRWRIANCNPLKVKSAPPPTVHTYNERIRPLAIEALAALKAGHFETVAPNLRAVLSGVPLQHRAEIQLPMSVLDALSSWAFEPGDIGHAESNGDSDQEAEQDVIDFVYAAAVSGPGLRRTD